MWSGGAVPHRDRRRGLRPAADPAGAAAPLPGLGYRWSPTLFIVASLILMVNTWSKSRGSRSGASSSSPSASRLCLVAAPRGARPAAGTGVSARPGRARECRPGRSPFSRSVWKSRRKRTLARPPCSCSPRRPSRGSAPSSSPPPARASRPPAFPFGRGGAHRRGFRLHERPLFPRQDRLRPALRRTPAGRAGAPPRARQWHLRHHSRLRSRAAGVAAHPRALPEDPPHAGRLGGPRLPSPPDGERPGPRRPPAGRRAGGPPGSVATGKYVDVLRRSSATGWCSLFCFAGTGDMARGALLLRAARSGEELEYRYS